MPLLLTTQGSISQPGQTGLGGGFGVLGLMTMQNSYRTEPSPGERFRPNEIRKIIDSVLETSLRSESYEPEKCAKMAQKMSEAIKSRVKQELNIPRFKLVCSVVIGQKLHQGVRCASRCLWNHHLDNCASASFENSTMFASATLPCSKSS